MVKNEKFSAYFKSKGFYLSLLAGITAIAAITLICYGFGVINQREDLPDLNEPLAKKEADLNVAENKTDSANNDVNKMEQAQTNSSAPVKETDTREADIKENVEELAQADEITYPAPKVPNAEPMGSQEVSLEEPEDLVPVMNAEGQKINNLSFNEETGLLWPVTGNVIMNFSMDKGIYFKTLGQYKCNPAIIIESEVGTEVKSAAKAMVTEVLENEETGLTVKTQIGNDYEVIYGQLKDIAVEEGDTLEEGSLIGYIDEPTKYYITEGSNLYFQVVQKEESVNPLLLLR